MKSVESILIEDTATPEQAASVAEVFLHHGGTDVEVQPAYGRRSADILRVRSAGGLGKRERRLAFTDVESTSLILSTRISEKALDALAGIGWSGLRGRARP